MLEKGVRCRDLSSENYCASFLQKGLVVRDVASSHHLRESKSRDVLGTMTTAGKAPSRELGRRNRKLGGGEPRQSIYHRFTLLVHMSENPFNFILQVTATSTDGALTNLKKKIF